MNGRTEIEDAKTGANAQNVTRRGSDAEPSADDINIKGDLIMEFGDMHVNSAGPHVSPSGASPVTFSKGNRTVTAQNITKGTKVGGNMIVTFGNMYVNNGPHVSSSGASPVMFSRPVTAQQVIRTRVVKGRPSRDTEETLTTDINNWSRKQKPEQQSTSKSESEQHVTRSGSGAGWPAVSNTIAPFGSDTFTVASIRVTPSTNKAQEDVAEIQTRKQLLLFLKTQTHYNFQDKALLIKILEKYKEVRGNRTYLNYFNCGFFGLAIKGRCKKDAVTSLLSILKTDNTSSMEKHLSAFNDGLLKKILKNFKSVVISHTGLSFSKGRIIESRCAMSQPRRQWDPKHELTMSPRG